jgi:hypothetical protein
MRTSTCRLSLLTLALAATLAVPCVGSGAHATGWLASVAQTAPETSGVDLLSQAWSWFRGLWPMAGCILDPNGGCVSYAGTPAHARRAGAPYRPAEGCILDPNGGCASYAARPAHTRRAGAPYRPAEGCGLDPNGACGSSIAVPPAVAGSNRRSRAGTSATRGSERR